MAEKFTAISGIGNAINFAILAIAFMAILFGLIRNLKVIASISNIFIFIVFGMVNFALLRYRVTTRRSERDKDVFRIPLNYRNIPIPTLLAFATILVLFVFNAFNLTL